VKKTKQYDHNFRLLFNNLFVKTIPGIAHSQVREYGDVLGTRPLHSRNNNWVKYVGGSLIPSGNIFTKKEKIM